MAATLNEEQVAACKKSFSASLKEGSSTIGLEQMREIVKALGFVDASEDDVVALFKESDADGSGAIDEAEFLELVKKLQAKAGGKSLFDGASSFFGPSPVDNASVLKSSILLSDEVVASWNALFTNHLKQGSSTIGLEQVREIVKAAGVEASEDEVVALFKECDADGSGAIDAMEFEVLMKMLQAIASSKKSSRGLFSAFKS